MKSSWEKFLPKNYLHVFMVLMPFMLWSCTPPTSVRDTPFWQLPRQTLGDPIRVLALTATAGFRHDSIPAARQALQSLASSTGEFTVAFTETLLDVSVSQLPTFDVLMFLLTSGELAFEPAQKLAIVRFVEDGGGFIGFHSATDTLYDWPDYGRLIGAYFKEHPWTQEATVTVEDRTHPSTTTLGETFRLREEYYTFRVNPRPTVQVLLSLDAPSVNATGDFPLAWAQAIGQGRSFYSALGHFDSTWQDPRLQPFLLGAIRWVGQRE